MMEDEVNLIKVDSSRIDTAARITAECINRAFDVLNTGPDSRLDCVDLLVPVSVSRRVMGMRSCDSRCLFSGSKGEVCSIEPLHAPADFRDHPITHYSLLAMASLTKVSHTTARPSGRETYPSFPSSFPSCFLSPDSGYWTEALT